MEGGAVQGGLSGGRHKAASSQLAQHVVLPSDSIGRLRTLHQTSDVVPQAFAHRDNRFSAQNELIWQSLPPAPEF
jgi:hypothetical protein